MVFKKLLDNNNNFRTVILLSVALVIITSAVYFQVGNHQFINFDDTVYVTENPHIAGGLTVNNIVWAFTSVDAHNWHPLTWLSHMTDAHLYGLNPRGHHLTSVAIHILSTLLLFLLLNRTSQAVWPSAFVAAMFALHPLHVESVAWVAERKDVLSTFFWFLTLLIYSHYVTRQKKVLYLLTFCSFMLGLMAKPMLVTLPVTMLLLDFWPLGRFQYGDQEQTRRHLSGRILLLVKEKIPFFVCSLCSALITIYAQSATDEQSATGAVAGLTVLPLLFRLENAAVAYVTYIAKTLCPNNLAVYYPYPESIPLWQYIGSFVILLLVSLIAIRTWRRHPYCAMGWCWFIITLLPVIGLIQVGNQSMADRYSYVSITGLFIMVTWGFSAMTKGLRRQRSLLLPLAATVMATSFVLSYKQLGFWINSISLFRHTVAITSNNYIIHNNLGYSLYAEGEFDAAIHEYRKALYVNPDFKEAHINLGNAFNAKGLLDAAVLEYQQALRINPADQLAHCNLGATLQAKGYLNEAIHEYQEALRLNPDYVDARNHLGTVYAAKGELDAAIREYQVILSMHPGNVKTTRNLEYVFEQKRSSSNNGR